MFPGDRGSARGQRKAAPASLVATIQPDAASIGNHGSLRATAGSGGGALWARQAGTAGICSAGVRTERGNCRASNFASNSANSLRNSFPTNPSNRLRFQQTWSIHSLEITCDEVRCSVRFSPCRAANLLTRWTTASRLRCSGWRARHSNAGASIAGLRLILPKNLSCTAIR